MTTKHGQPRPPRPPPGGGGAPGGAGTLANLKQPSESSALRPLAAPKPMGRARP